MRLRPYTATCWWSRNERMCGRSFQPSQLPIRSRDEGFAPCDAEKHAVGRTAMRLWFVPKAEPSAATGMTTIQCSCGTVKVELTGEPVAQFYFHCDEALSSPR